MSDLPYSDPSNPALPSPLFSDVTAVRADHMRANNAAIFADLTALNNRNPELVALTSGSFKTAALANANTYNGRSLFTCTAGVSDTPSAAAWRIVGYWNPTDSSGRFVAQADASLETWEINYSGAAWGTWTQLTDSSGNLTRDVIGGVPPGTVLPYAGSTAPTYYLMCDGSAVSRTTYAALFAVIGTTFGTGDGSTTFNLPDLCGVFIKGAGTTDRAAGKDASGNYYSGTLGTYSTDKMQGHYHGIHNDASLIYASGGAAEFATGGTYQFGATIYVTNPTSDGTNGTPRTGHTTEPQSLALNHIIKY